MAPNRWTRNARRLTQATWGELRVRAVQEIAKRWDSTVYRAFLHRSTNSLPPDIDSVPFFTGPKQLSRTIEFLRAYLPASVDDNVRRAQSICRHQFDLLGYENLDYGDPIDWHLDAVNGKRAPRKAFFKVRYLDFEEVGDVKVTWELNRHQHLVTLAKAYCLTQDECFAAEAQRQWYHWQRENPYPLGVNWASSLEVAFRSLSWLWMWHLCAKCPLFSIRFQSDLECALLLSGRHIERYLSTYFSPNTHLLGEGVALFFLGLLCSHSAVTARWKKLGWEIVLREAERQVLTDGMHFEQSTYYHVYALDLFLHARILASLNGIEIPPQLDCALEKMLNALALLGAGGVPLRFGDDDGGRLFNPHRNHAEHLLDPLSTGAVLFDRLDFRALKHEVTEETVWLLGPEAAARFQAMTASPVAQRSAAMEASGAYLLADQKSAYRLWVDVGPQGADSAGHGHADALSVQLTKKDHDLLTDSGSFVYVGKGDERQRFRGTEAHNTLQVDGADQAEAAGPFSWKSVPNVCRETWVPGGSFDLLIASHDGYRRLPGAVLHRRAIFRLRSEFWLLLDIVEGNGNHRLSNRWHLAPGSRWDVGPNAAIGGEGSDRMALVWCNDSNWIASVSRGSHSPVYGVEIENQVLTLAYEGRVPVAFAGVLLPEPERRRGCLSNLRNLDAANDCYAYCYGYKDESHCMFFGAAQRPWRCCELASDADFLYYGKANSNGERLILCGGTYVAVNDRRVLTCSRSVSSLEWSSRDAQLSCSDQSAVIAVAWENFTWKGLMPQE